MLSSSSLWWESIVALVVSNCPRATFILSCSWKSSLVSPAGPTLGGVWCWEIKDVPTISGVHGTPGWNSWGMVWVRLGVPSGVATHGGSVQWLLVGWGWLTLSPFTYGDLLLLLLRVGLPGPLMVAFSWVYYCGRQGWMLQRKFYCSYSRAPWRCWFMAMAMSQGGSIVSTREWVGTSVVMGT